METIPGGFPQEATGKIFLVPILASWNARLSFILMSFFDLGICTNFNASLISCCLSVRDCPTLGDIIRWH